MFQRAEAAVFGSMSLLRLFELYVVLAGVHASVARNAANPAECREDGHKDFFGEDKDLSLVQRRAQKGIVKNGSDTPEPPSHLLYEEPFCRQLTNRGAYHTVVVEVGVPPQKFNLVADTGANSLILPDCSCMKSGSCSGIHKCFETNHSETFALKMMESDGDESGVPQSAMLYFGSGPINCTLASDKVKLGDATAVMPDIFMMEDRNDLKVTSSFEGLLGLGQPRDPEALVSDTMKKDLFMKVAEVDRYSICFNADANGIFRMNVPKLSEPMSSIGDLHWAFDFQGISVGNAKADDVLFCHPSTKQDNMNSACNAVPDSGTTMMLGPREHLIDLFAALCEEWPRCANYSKEEQIEDKSQAFQKLVSNCKAWMGDDGVEEIPPIKLHLAGGEGKQQVFELSPWSWVVKTPYPIYVFIQERLWGKDWKKLMHSGDDEEKDYCSTMFSSHLADTDINGPQWLFGSPLFFEKVVHFDIGSDPPKMSISNSPCTACEDQPSLLAASESTPVHAHPGRDLKRRVRSLTEFPRMPHWDFTQPL